MLTVWYSEFWKNTEALWTAFETEGYSGEPLLTNRKFEECRRSFELDIEKHDALYINAF